MAGSMVTLVTLTAISIVSIVSKSLDVFVELPQDLIDRIEAESGVRITDYRIDFFGYRNPSPEVTASNEASETPDIDSKP